MSVSPNTITLTNSMKYGDAKRLIAAAWSRLAIIIYRPTLEHYKDGPPGAEELEPEPEEELCRTSGRETILHGGMTSQGVHSAVMRAFSLETEISRV